MRDCVCVTGPYLDSGGSSVGHFFNMATIQEETTMQKIMRRAHLSTVMGVCTYSEM